MKLEWSTASRRVALTLQPQEMADLVKRHLEKINQPSAAEVETIGLNFVDNDFDPEDVHPFCEAVIKFGGDRFGRIMSCLQEQTPVELASRFANAVQIGNMNLGAALDAIMSVNGLSLSYGSKHLRFMSPEKFVILDSRINKFFGYELSIAGYRAFAEDCGTVAARLTEEGIENPMPNRNGRWLPCDVEMAIYAKSKCW